MNILIPKLKKEYGELAKDFLNGRNVIDIIGHNNFLL